MKARPPQFLNTRQGLLIANWAGLPAHERIVDCLANLVADADELLETLNREDAAGMRWIASDVQAIHDHAAALMTGLVD